MTKRTILAKEQQQTKELFYNIQNAIGQNSSSVNWLNIAAKIREYIYSRINGQLFHERGEILGE